MENYNKIAISVITAAIIGFLSTTVALFGKVSTMEMKIEYLEKKQDDCITTDKLENAKLVLAQQFGVRCK